MKGSQNFELKLINKLGTLSEKDIKPSYPNSEEIYIYTHTHVKNLNKLGNLWTFLQTIYFRFPQFLQPTIHEYVN